ncbi:hypothetical protein C5167_041361 [Papaver somniferum]|nr:hypothetical protein C5167_041361 [Papaver somniferum]
MRQQRKLNFVFMQQLAYCNNLKAHENLKQIFCTKSTGGNPLSTQSKIIPEPLPWSIILKHQPLCTHHCKYLLSSFT